mmetsp:Transcript_41847/g.131954  ORF Transcript_41847/g.131954 Transcript_41847/m.131954 type:complete len:902 (-) Transcript_41847:63-2768(-)
MKLSVGSEMSPGIKNVTVKKEGGIPHAKGSKILPGNLPEPELMRALEELPVGARLATNTVFQCWRDGKFADDEFLTFLNSISSYSPQLTSLLRNQAGSSGPAAGAKNRNNQFGLNQNKSLQQSSLPDETESAMGINKEWRARRRQESLRRRFHGIQGNLHQRCTKYICKILSQLRSSLPVSARVSLLDIVTAFLNKRLTPEAFGEAVLNLVDQYQVTVLLNYIPQRSYGFPIVDASTKRHTMECQMESNRNLPSNSKRSKSTLPPLKSASPTLPAAMEATDTIDCCRCQHDPVDDHRYVRCNVCNRAFHHVCALYDPTSSGRAHFQCGLQDCASSSIPTRSIRYRPEDLVSTPLGDFLTARARMTIPNPSELVVKVVSDKDVYKQLPEPLSKVNARSYSWCSYRCKSILAFRKFPNGSEVVFFGMYVHEYGRACPPSNAGRVFLECIDSTPLYSEERGSERQDILTSIIIAYLEYVSAQGFSFAHMRVAPPTDENGYIFASRTVNVRLRAAMHLAHWLKRLLNLAISRGVISSYNASPHSSMNNFPPSLLEPSHLAADIAFRYAGSGPTSEYGFLPGVGAIDKHPSGSAFVQKIAALKERFFVIVLAPKDRTLIDSETQSRLSDDILLPSTVAGSRADLVGLFQQVQLSFHTLAHNNYSTMILVQKLFEEQQNMKIVRPVQNYLYQDIPFNSCTYPDGTRSIFGETGSGYSANSNGYLQYGLNSNSSLPYQFPYGLSDSRTLFQGSYPIEVWNGRTTAAASSKDGQSNPMNMMDVDYSRVRENVNDDPHRRGAQSSATSTTTTSMSAGTDTENSEDLLDSILGAEQSKEIAGAAETKILTNPNESMAAEDVLSLGAGNLNEVVTWMDAQQEQQMQEDDLKSACMDGISTEEQNDWASLYSF